MDGFILKALLCLPIATCFSTSSSRLNFKASFGSTPSPFSIDVDAGFLTEATTKVTATRYVQDLHEQPEFTEGPPKHNVTTIRNYWVEEYNWEDVQAELNEK